MRVRITRSLLSSFFFSHPWKGIKKAFKRTADVKSTNEPRADLTRGEEGQERWKVYVSKKNLCVPLFPRERERERDRYDASFNFVVFARSIRNIDSIHSPFYPYLGVESRKDDEPLLFSH